LIFYPQLTTLEQAISCIRGEKNMIASPTGKVETTDDRASHPKVSIGMPVFNSEKYLSQTLESILAQTWTDFEVILFDNGSTDQSQEICQAFQSKDSRVRYVRSSQSLSVASQYNRLVELALGDYFKWAAPDDLLAHNFLERCIAVLNREQQVVVCYPRTRLIDAADIVFGTYADELNLRSPQPHRRLGEFYGNQGLCHPIYGLIRMDVLRHSGLLGEFPMADRILLSELALSGEICEIPAYLFLRRIHSDFSARIHSTDSPYDINSKGKAQFIKWQHLMQYIKAIQRVELGVVEKVHCYLQLTRLILFPKRWANSAAGPDRLLTPLSFARRWVGRNH
jgi:glycosyltransferase involved in cell wall biosynthesis